MAVGNLFQGMARGKVGDVVFSRLNGQQISRVRNRSPRNPNTNKQLVQRAVMANIMAMYSAGQTIFNHAFQGKAVGAENQREFMKSNVNLLRSLVVSEMNAGTAAADCKGHVGMRGMNIASPFEGAIISKGTYDQSVFTFENTGFKLPTVNANETIGAYAARIGLIPGDLYTFIAYGVGYDDVMANLNVEQESASGNTDRLYNCRFEYVQFKVKENILANTTAITAATVITDLFDDYQHSGEPFADEFLLTGTIGVQDILSYADAGCIGCIRSREYEDLRSNSFLHVSTGKWGFTTNYLLSVWDETTTLQGTALVLEGSNFSQAGGSAEPTLPTELGFYGIRESFTSGGQTIVNPIVSFNPVDKNATIAFSGECDDVAGQADLWNIVDGEPEVSETVVGLTTSQINAFTSVICQYLSDKYGVEISASNCVTGDEGYEDVTLNGYM